MRNWILLKLIFAELIKIKLQQLKLNLIEVAAYHLYGTPATEVYGKYVAKTQNTLYTPFLFLIPYINVQCAAKKKLTEKLKITSSLTYMYVYAYRIKIWANIPTVVESVYVKQMNNLFCDIFYIWHLQFTFFLLFTIRFLNKDKNLMILCRKWQWMIMERERGNVGRGWAN